jgi:tRNA 5-methylaminomethyl-2-thiouridine biosynthesis bifunctional protein
VMPRHLPRVDGLYVLAGLGSRGITSAALAGRLLASWITGAPCPVEQRLRDAVDPGRYCLRG